MKRGKQVSRANRSILLCTVYLCWTWLHCSCWSLNIGAFSNYLTILIVKTNFICFYAYNTLIYTHPPSPPYPLFSGDLGTLSLGIPYHTCNATKVARETTVFFFFFQSPANEFYVKMCFIDYSRFTKTEFLKPICTLSFLRLGYPRRECKFGCEIFPKFNGPNSINGKRLC